MHKGCLQRSLAGYMAHELEELLEEMEQLHPEYEGIPVARLLRGATAQGLEAVEEAIDAGSRAGFMAGYDALTAACNACHSSTGRGFLVIQRPTAPPATNLRFRE